jgi:AP-1 complex subunit beta-1
VSSAPEVQWVALRNINLILQKRPEILSSEIRVFFCKYNDPPYLKTEKLEIMIKLATEKNIDTLLSELKEYASEADVDFVRKAVRAIGLCAIRVDPATERCVASLMELTATRVSYIVQEAIVVLKVRRAHAASGPLIIFPSQDIFRRFPQRFEGVIPELCSNLEDLDEPDAKASLIWMIGEYADRITNAEELLGKMLKTLIDEPYQVSLLSCQSH